MESEILTVEEIELIIMAMEKVEDEFGAGDDDLWGTEHALIQKLERMKSNQQTREEKKS